MVEEVTNGSEFPNEAFVPAFNLEAADRKEKKKKLKKRIKDLERRVAMLENMLWRTTAIHVDYKDEDWGKCQIISTTTTNL